MGLIFFRKCEFCKASKPDRYVTWRGFDPEGAYIGYINYHEKCYKHAVNNYKTIGREEAELAVKIQEHRGE